MKKKTKYFQVDERTTTKDETSKRLPISKEVYKKSLPLRMNEIQKILFLKRSWLLSLSIILICFYPNIGL